MVPITGGTPARLAREASVQRRDFITPEGVGHPLVYFHLGKRDSDFEAVEPPGNGSIVSSPIYLYIIQIWVNPHFLGAFLAAYWTIPGSNDWIERLAGGVIRLPPGITVSWSYGDDTVDRLSRPTPKSAANPTTAQRPLDGSGLYTTWRRVPFAPIWNRSH